MTDSFEDFRRKYRGTFLIVETGNKKVIARYEDDDANKILFRSYKYGDIICSFDKIQSNISYHFPKSGLYNGERHALYFSRYANRQWKRAPSHDNCTVVKLGGMYNREEVSTRNMERIFNPIYPASIDEGIDQIKESVALDNKIGVSVLTKKKMDRLVLWYKNTPVGMLNHKDKVIELENHNLEQETTDFFTKRDPEWKILKA